MNRLYGLSSATTSLVKGVLFSLAMLVSLNASAAEDLHDDHEEGEEEVVQISAALARELGIETEIAGAGVISSTAGPCPTRKALATYTHAIQA